MNPSNFKIILDRALINKRKRENRVSQALLEAKLAEALAEKELVKNALNTIQGPEKETSDPTYFEGYFSLTIVKLDLNRTINALRSQIRVLVSKSV